MALLMWWLFGGLVVPITRAFFYVTETQPLKFATVYYRKPVWRALEAKAIANLTGFIYEVWLQGARQVASSGARDFAAVLCAVLRRHHFRMIVLKHCLVLLLVELKQHTTSSGANLAL
jgi:hypothetical protein